MRVPWQPGDVRWLDELEQDGEVVLRVGRDGAGHLVVELVGQATVRCGVRGEDPELIAEPGTPPEEVEALRGGFLRAVLNHVRGMTTLHASSVATPDGVLSFAGVSGSGKSTMAAAMCERRGLELLADDVTPICARCSDVCVAPTSGRTLLLQDTLVALGLAGAPGRKLATPARTAATSARPLRAIVQLEFDQTLDAPVLRRLRGHEAVGTILKNTFHFALDDVALRQAELDNLFAIAGAAGIYELRRPRDFAMLDRTLDQLIDLLGPR